MGGSQKITGIVISFEKYTRPSRGGRYEVFVVLPKFLFQEANAAGTSDQVILVGAASKGIIQREFQHNATVYKTPYAKNPFDAVTDEEIEKYKKDITRKQKGDSYCKSFDAY